MKKSKAPFLLRLVQWSYPKLEKLSPRLAHRLFVTIFFTPLNYPVPDKEKAIKKSAHRFRFRAAHQTISGYSWGEGPVVLLVHGWAGRGTQFRKFIPQLVKAGFRAVAFDGPAHGESSGRSTNIDEFEEVLREIYNRVGIPDGIIAHSFGGGAVLYAAMKGLPVKKLINVASPTIGDEIINTYLKTINGSTATAKSFKQHILEMTGKGFDEFTSLHFVRHITQDIDLLLVHDEQDTEVSVAHARELVKVYPTASLFLTQGLGHTRILKDDRVIERCIVFLTENLSKETPFNTEADS